MKNEEQRIIGSQSWPIVCHGLCNTSKWAEEQNTTAPALLASLGSGNWHPACIYILYNCRKWARYAALLANPAKCWQFLHLAFQGKTFLHRTFKNSSVMPKQMAHGGKMLQRLTSHQCMLAQLLLSCSLESPDLKLAQGNSQSVNFTPGAMLWYPAHPLRRKRWKSNEVD